MRKKDFEADASVSILLTVPEGTSHKQAAAEFLEAQAHSLQPFFFNADEGTVTIDMVREMIAHSSFARAAAEPQAVVVCAVHTATIPAQNALLKIIEEPPAHTQFILTTCPGHSLLSTLLSRCREILWTATESNEEEAAQANLHALRDFLNDPAHFSYSQCIDLSEQLKDGSAAKYALKTCIASSAATFSPTVVQKLLSALSALEKNGNVRLTLEHCFFAVKAAASAQNR